MFSFRPPNIQKLLNKHDVKGLIEALQYQKDPKTRQAAAIALGMLSAEALLMPLVLNHQKISAKDMLVSTAKSDENDNVRQTAVRVLLILREKDWNAMLEAGKALSSLAPRVVEILASIAQSDEDDSIRQTATSTLVEYLGTKDLRSEAEKALIELGPIAARPLVKALDLYNPPNTFFDSRYLTEEKLLMKIGDPCVDILAQSLRDKGTRSVIRIIRVLGKIGGRGLESLITIVKEEGIEEDVRCAVVNHLVEVEETQVGKAQLADAIFIALSDKKLINRLNYPKVLIRWRQLDDKPSIQSWLILLKHPKTVIRNTALNALGEIGGVQLIEPLIESLSDYDDDVRQAALKILKTLGWQPENDLILALLDEDWEKVIQYRLEAVDPLINILRDGNQSIHRRKAAATALGRIGDTKAIEALTNRFSDSNLRDHVYKILIETKHPTAIKYIVERLGLDFDINSSLRALEKIGDASAINGLLQKIKDSDKPRIYIELLKVIIRRDVANIAKDELHSLANLKAEEVHDRIYHYSDNDVQSGGPLVEIVAFPIDCTEINEIAKRELANR